MLGTSISTWPTRVSNTASRDRSACSSRASRVRRSLMLERSSSIVSNSDASLANSSSASGSSGALHLADSHLNVGILVLPRTADQLRREGRRLASRHSGDSLIESVQHRPDPMVYSTSSAVASTSGSPSRLATRLIVTVSPSGRGPPVSRDPKQLRSTSTCWSTSVSGTSSVDLGLQRRELEQPRTRAVCRPRP